ncbi:MAG: hypothetical protein ABIR59_09355 [Gemmatimonadales bacterium]
MPSPEILFRLPAPQRTAWWIPVAVVVVHLPLIFISMVRSVDRAGSPTLLRFELTGARGSAEVVMAPFVVATVGRPTRGRRLAPAAVPVTAVSRTPDVASPATVPPAQPPRSQPAVSIPLTPPTPPGVAPARRTIRPAFASGRLWVRPLPVSPQELAGRMGTLSHDEKVDSAVTAMIQDYLDQLAADESANPQLPPSWTTRIGGQKVGVDSKWFYLGPIRVPTFLLALIPINIQANPTQADMNRRLNAMRADLFEAARRASNYADFKDAVGHLRDETQRRRDFDKAQRSTPDEPEGTR